MKVSFLAEGIAGPGQKEERARFVKYLVGPGLPFLCLSMEHGPNG